MSQTETYLLFVDDEMIIFSNLLLLCRTIKAEKKYATIRRKLLKKTSTNYNGYIIRKSEPVQKSKRIKK